jgi:hypothetical protein
MPDATASLPVIAPPTGVTPGTQGLARVVALDDLVTVTVVFKTPLSAAQKLAMLDPKAYTLTGGQRLFPRVTGVSLNPPGTPASEQDRRVQLALDGPGDFSTYTLTVSGPGLDPIADALPLRFRLACDDVFDCRPGPPPAPTTTGPAVLVDYLAKDYAGFRQALLDFIPTRIPDWTEPSEADLGMMLLELFAATADQLSYLQDRVACEAYLDTATQRRSVAGHLALVGYELGATTAACVWLQFRVRLRHTLTPASRFPVTSRVTVEGEAAVVFETLGTAVLRPGYGDPIPVIAPPGAAVTLAAGALSATLSGSFPDFQTGDALCFDDDAGHREVVLLSAAPQLVAGTGAGSAITVVQWSAATPIQADFGPGAVVARGNLVLAAEGQTVVNEVVRDANSGPDDPGVRQRLPLAQEPLAYLDAATLATFAGPGAAAAAAAAAGFAALSSRHVSTITLHVGDAPDVWQERSTLLDSGPTDRVFRVEIDNPGGATVVFGDGTFGLRPVTTARVAATYRVGGGSAGNVAADTLGVFDPAAQAANPWLIAVTNPLRATGGRDQEPLEHARRFGPPSVQTPLVAVTADDYRDAAQGYTDDLGQTPVRRASASLRWSGSWLMATLAVDHRDAAAVTDAALRGPLLASLDARRLVGSDVEVAAPSFVAVDLAVDLDLAPGFLPASVTQAVADAFSNRDLPGGRTGFFHPDNFSFGNRLDVSAVYAELMAVPGVAAARVVRLARLRSARPDQETAVNLGQGYLAVGPNEILRLDNDRNFPENGTLTLQVSGVAS